MTRNRLSLICLCAVASLACATFVALPASAQQAVPQTAPVYSPAPQAPAYAPVTPLERPTMIVEAEEPPIADNQLLAALHVTAVGPVGPFALELGADLGGVLGVRLIAGYVDEDYEHFGISPSHLEGLQAGGFVTARIDLGRWTLRPGVGLTGGAFDGEMLFDEDKHDWVDTDEFFGGCILGCNEDVKLDTVLWMHIEMAAQLRFSEGFFFRGYGGFSAGLAGWGLQNCEDCGGEERAAKSSELFGSAIDFYGGVALGHAFELR